MRRLATPIALLLAAVALASLAPACGSEGTTPTCVNNVGVDGITPTEDGCQEFAVCSKGRAADCCTVQDSPYQTAEDPSYPCWQARCLYGFGEPIDVRPLCGGEVPPDTGSGAGGAGGTGGAGGAGGGDAS